MYLIQILGLNNVVIQNNFCSNKTHNVDNDVNTPAYTTEVYFYFQRNR